VNATTRFVHCETAASPPYLSCGKVAMLLLMEVGEVKDRCNYAYRRAPPAGVPFPGDR